MKRILMTLCAALALGAASAAESTPALGDEKSLYDLLDLARPGMKAVKKADTKVNVATQDKQLQNNFRTRKPVELFGLDLENVKVSKLEQKQIESLTKNVEYTKDLFAMGNSTYLEVISAQQSLLNAELAKVQDDFYKMQAVVNLYYALGGGRD